MVQSYDSAETKQLVEECLLSTLSVGDRIRVIKEPDTNLYEIKIGNEFRVTETCTRFAEKIGWVCRRRVDTYGLVNFIYVTPDQLVFFEKI